MSRERKVKRTHTKTHTQIDRHPQHCIIHTKAHVTHTDTHSDVPHRAVSRCFPILWELWSLPLPGAFLMIRPPPDPCGTTHTHTHTVSVEHYRIHSLSSSDQPGTFQFIIDLGLSTGADQKSCGRNWIDTTNQSNKTSSWLLFMKMNMFKFIT